MTGSVVAIDLKRRGRGAYLVEWAAGGQSGAAGRPNETADGEQLRSRARGAPQSWPATFQMGWAAPRARGVQLADARSCGRYGAYQGGYLKRATSRTRTESLSGSYLQVASDAGVSHGGEPRRGGEGRGRRRAEGSGRRGGGRVRAVDAYGGGTRTHGGVEEGHAACGEPSGPWCCCAATRRQEGDAAHPAIGEKWPSPVWPRGAREKEATKYGAREEATDAMRSARKASSSISTARTMSTVAPWQRAIEANSSIEMPWQRWEGGAWGHEGGMRPPGGDGRPRKARRTARRRGGGA